MHQIEASILDVCRVNWIHDGEFVSAQELLI